jgi:hypothetical protein
MKKYSNCKEINKLVKKLVSLGYIYLNGKKHGRLLFPDGRFCTSVPGSPSDHRAYKNFYLDTQRSNQC